MVNQQEVVMENKSTRNKLQEIQEFYSDGRDEDILMMLSKDACSLVSAAMSRSEVIKSKKRRWRFEVLREDQRYRIGDRRYRVV